MIPIDQQVCSLELAKKLKELGVRQESYFYWVNDQVAGRDSTFFRKDDYILVNDITCGGCHEHLLSVDENDVYSAYLASELGEMLPVSFWRGILSKYWLTIRVMESPNPKYEINYMFYVNELFPTIKDDKLSEALGNALCLLIENGYVKAEAL